MNRTNVTNIICLLVLSMIFGCTFSVNINDETETDMGSHHVIVKPGSAITSSTSFTSGADETHTFTCGAVTVKIENEMLIVNEKNYGSLEKGQSIEIDQWQSVCFRSGASRHCVECRAELKISFCLTRHFYGRKSCFRKNVSASRVLGSSNAGCIIKLCPAPLNIFSSNFWPFAFACSTKAVWCLKR